MNASRKNLAYSAARSFFGVLRDTNFNSLRTTNNIANGVRLWCSAGYQLQFSENHQQYCQWCQTCLHNHPGLMALLAHKHIICHLDEHEQQQLHLIELSEGDLVVQMGSHPWISSWGHTGSYELGHISSCAYLLTNLIQSKYIFIARSAAVVRTAVALSARLPNLNKVIEERRDTGDIRSESQKKYEEEGKQQIEHLLVITWM